MKGPRPEDFLDNLASAPPPFSTPQKKQKQKLNKKIKQNKIKKWVKGPRPEDFFDNLASGPPFSTQKEAKTRIRQKNKTKQN